MDKPEGYPDILCRFHRQIYFDNKDLTWFKPRIPDLVWFGFEIPKCGIYPNTVIKWRRKSEPSLIRCQGESSRFMQILHRFFGSGLATDMLQRARRVCFIFFERLWGNFWRLFWALAWPWRRSNYLASGGEHWCKIIFHFSEDTGTQKSALNARPCGKLRQGITAASISMTVEHASHFW